MPDPTTQKLTIAEYKEAQTKLSELMAKAVTGFAAAQQVGDLVAAKAWSETLVLPIASLKGQFEQLSLQERFVYKYSVEKINDHQVRLVLPKGVSRIDLLNEAQGIARELYGRDAVYPDHLKDWQKEDDFRTKTTSKTKLWIDGRVEGLDGKTRKQQERLIKKQWGETQMAPLADLAVAHAAFYILTGENLFQGQVVRACDGMLYFSGDGLGDYIYYVAPRDSDVSASRSLPSTN